MLTKKIIITAILVLIAASAGGYIYSKPQQDEQAATATPTGFGMQPVVEPGTINTANERAWSPADMNKLRRHK